MKCQVRNIIVIKKKGNTEYTENQLFKTAIRNKQQTNADGICFFLLNILKKNHMIHIVSEQHNMLSVL